MSAHRSTEVQAAGQCSHVHRAAGEYSQVHKAAGQCSQVDRAASCRSVPTERQAAGQCSQVHRAASLPVWSVFRHYVGGRHERRVV